MSDTPHLDRLAAALFDGPTKLDHFSFTPGTDPTATAEQRAAAIYASMERRGLIVDGRLREPCLVREAAEGDVSTCPRCGRSGVIDCRMEDWEPVCRRTIEDRQRGHTL